MKAITLAEIDVPHCALTYGVPPCQAQLGFVDGSSPSAAKFDGTNDYLTRGGNLSGVVDGKAGTLSVWVRLLGGDGANMEVLCTTNGRLELIRTNSNLFQLFGRNAANTIILNIGTVSSTVASGWLHLLMAWDLAAGVVKAYVNDVDVTTANTVTNDTIDYTDTNFAVGATPGAAQKLNGLLAEIWLNTTTFIDLTVVANRRKFISADLRPVFLGATGQVPTGAAPALFLGNPAASFQTNLGTGGNFTVTGALENATFATGTIKCHNSLGTCQDRQNFTDVPVTLRFAQPTDYLPSEFDAIPSIKEVDLTPAIISLGENIGQRGALDVTFKDHPHTDTPASVYDKYLAERDYDPFQRGSYWGKFRARNPFLRGKTMRLLLGSLGQPLTSFEVRTYIIESTEGPRADGTFTITAKDPLKLLDGDRAQAPRVSNGFLVADITAVAAALTLSPSGVSAEYDNVGHAAIGGSEIVQYNKGAGDLINLTARGMFGTAAQAHTAQDRFQQVLIFSPQDPAVIISHLLEDFADVPAGYINNSTWQAETAILNRLYSAVIAEPTSVAVLVSELIEQAALAIWWDDLESTIRLQVLRGIVTEAAQYSEDNTIERSFGVKEQPDKRISQVWTYFGLINPLKRVADPDNYRSTAAAIDTQAEADYGSPAIKRIFSRWIPAFGRSVADRLNAIQLGRFRDPPRKFSFSVLRGPDTIPLLGTGYLLAHRTLQDETGARTEAPIQITRLNPGVALFEVEADEISFDVPDEDLTNRSVVIDSNINNVNLRSMHDAIYPAPVSGDVVTCRIDVLAVVGSSSIFLPAVDVGSWPAGVIVNVTVLGRLQGCGGEGGDTANLASDGKPGGPGGPALLVRFGITLNIPGGRIWSGGGGGGSAASWPTEYGGGGGGGAGQLAGDGGGPQNPGNPGAEFNGGEGGDGFKSADGGRGGDPGQPGQSGGPSPFDVGGPGGAAGAAIDGVSFVSFGDTTGGEIRGSQIN